MAQCLRFRLKNNDFGKHELQGELDFEATEDY